MDRVRVKLHADEIHKIGITGKSIVICVLDSGCCGHGSLTVE